MFLVIGALIGEKVQEVLRRLHSPSPSRVAAPLSALARASAAWPQQLHEKDHTAGSGSLRILTKAPVSTRLSPAVPWTLRIVLHVMD